MICSSGRSLLIDDLDKVKPGEFRESIDSLLIDRHRPAESPIALSCNVPSSAQEDCPLTIICPVEMQRRR